MSDTLTDWRPWIGYGFDPMIFLGFFFFVCRLIWQKLSFCALNGHGRGPEWLKIKLPGIMQSGCVFSVFCWLQLIDSLRNFSALKKLKLLSMNSKNASITRAPWTGRRARSRAEKRVSMHKTALGKNLCCKRAMKLMKIYCADYDLWAFLLLSLFLNWNLPPGSAALATVFNVFSSLFSFAERF